MSVGRESCRFWVAGISDFWEGRHDVAQALSSVPDSAPVIAFTHNPDVFPSIPARVSLTIAGQHPHLAQMTQVALRPVSHSMSKD